MDDATKFLTGLVTGEKAKTDEQAILTLTNLMQGTPETPQAADEAVRKLVSLAQGKQV